MSPRGLPVRGRVQLLAGATAIEVGLVVDRQASRPGSTVLARGGMPTVVWSTST